jgi:hypothetical protein
VLTGSTSDAVLFGRAHARAYPSPKRSAALHGHHLATEYQHRKSGPPSVVRYALNAHNKFRLVARMKVVAHQEIVEQWSPAQRMDRFRELRVELALAEAELVRMETRNASQLDMAEADERISELRAERAAIRAIFAKVGITEADVWGRR